MPFWILSIFSRVIRCFFGTVSRSVAYPASSTAVRQPTISSRRLRFIACPRQLAGTSLACASGFPDSILKPGAYFFPLQGAGKHLMLGKEIPPRSNQEKHVQ